MAEAAIKKVEKSSKEQGVKISEITTMLQQLLQERAQEKKERQRDREVQEGA